ncbi:MAG: hypothetical protein HY447_03545 [Candidatus Omnitrophica bacterium]|nr:hypothetical protein [Candidatus Omnitrophota bacterium]
MTAMEGKIEKLNEVISHQQAFIENQASQIKALQSAIGEGKPTETVYLPTKEELDRKVNVGAEKLTMGGLLQGWYTYAREQDDMARVRRTELKFAGEITKDLKWTVMIDPVQVREDNTRRSILQDAYFTFGYIPKHKIDIGQFKIPVSEEGLRSSAKLDTIERAFISRTFGDHRDIGAMLTGDWDFIMYQGGIFNGEEQNRLDVNDKKDYAWRVVLRPFRFKGLENEVLKDLELGMSQYYRDSNDSTVFTEKRRFGYEARWEYDRYSLKGEAAFGQTAASPIWGWYGQAGYYLIPKKLQGILKVDSFEQNERAPDDRANDFTLGLNYFLDDYHAKFQLNYVLRQGQDDLNDNQVIGAVQVAY